MKRTLKISGMSCGHCVKHVSNALSDIEGVTNVAVSLENNTATVETNNEIADSVFADALEEAGYSLNG